MVNTVRVNAAIGRVFHPLANYMIQLTTFHQGFLAFPFSFELLFDLTLSNLLM